MFGLLGPAKADSQMGRAYDYEFKTLMDGGQPLPLSQFRGKVILVVNTASHCGFTKQYDGLQQLYDRYKDQGFVIIGIPSNDFGSQEPGSSEEISSFCKKNFGVTFPMAGKEGVSGDAAHPFYRWAREKVGFLGAPKWNFHKYLIDRNGNLVDYFNSNTSPNSSAISKAIEKYLNEPTYKATAQ